MRFDSLSGKSLEEMALFSEEEKELNKNIMIWTAQLSKVVEEESVKMWSGILQEGKVRKEDERRMMTKVKDVLYWLWFNTFVSGDKSVEVGSEFSFSNDDVAEFARNKEEERNRIIKEIELFKRNVSIDQRKLEEARKKGETFIEDYDENIKLKKYTLSDYEKNYIGSKQRAIEKLQVRLNDLQTPSVETQKQTQSDQDIERLKKIDRAQKDAASFMQTSDFGRIYVQKRGEYISETYVDKTKTNMQNVFNRLNNPDGTEGFPVQNYFEKNKMQMGKKGMKIGRYYLKTEETPDADGTGINVADIRIAPKPQKNINPEKEKQLYEEVKAKFPKITEDYKIRRIVETEVVAAYNTGRLHKMYQNKVRLVRWVNDVENRQSGKVCKPCMIRAFGTSQKIRNSERLKKEGLAGVYTIEEVMTDRQLSLPLHPMCQCVVRPLTKQEEDIIAAMNALPDGGFETAVTAITGVGINGVSNAQIEKEDDRSKWWYGAAAVGAAAVGIGALTYYLRKSLTSKAAAQVVKERGEQIIQQRNVKALNRIPDVTKQDLEQSLRIADAEDMATSTIRRKGYRKSDLEQYPELRQPLPDFSTIDKTEVREQIMDDLEPIMIGKLVNDDLEMAINNLEIPLPKEAAQEKLDHIIDTLVEKETNLKGSVNDVADDVVRRYQLESIVEVGDEIKRAINLKKQLNDRVENLAERPSAEQIAEWFDNLKVVDLENVEVPIEIGGQRLATRKLKQQKVNIKKYFSTNGTLDQDLQYLAKIEIKLERKTGVIERKEYNEILSRLKKIQKERALLDLALEENNQTLLFEHIQNAKDELDDELKAVADKLDERFARIVRVNDKLGELRRNTKSYRQKLIDSEVTDPFVTKTKLENVKDITVKQVAITERNKMAQTIDSMVADLGRTKTSVIENYFQLKSFPDILQSLNYTQEQFVDKLARDRNGLKKDLRDLRDKLRNDAARIQRVEFNLFQKKWAMFGSPQ